MILRLTNYLAVSDMCCIANNGMPSHHQTVENERMFIEGEQPLRELD